MSEGSLWRPDPCLPDYGGRCISSIVPALLDMEGESPSWIPGPARGARAVVLLVLDGLGWGQLQLRANLAPTLTSMAGESITSVAPTTTATALASIALGAAPGEHGLVGYKLAVSGPSGSEVMNVLRWRTVSGDAREFVAPEDFQTIDAFGGKSVPVVSKLDFAGSGFSRAHLRGSRLRGWAVASSIAVEVSRQISAGETLVYAYYDGIDKVAHVRGFGAEYDAELSAVDRIVDDVLAVLPGDVALLVTADHGQVEVGDRVEQLDPDVLAEASMVSGEARFRWLHAGPGGVDRLVAATRDRYGHQAWVLTVDEAIGAGWFGAEPNAQVRNRLGDVALVPWEPVAYLEPTDSETRLVCRHGSLTEAEMLVPLLAATGRQA